MKILKKLNQQKMIIGQSMGKYIARKYELVFIIELFGR